MAVVCPEGRPGPRQRCDRPLVWRLWSVNHPKTETLHLGLKSFFRYFTQLWSVADPQSGMGCESVKARSEIRFKPNVERLELGDV